MRNSKPTAVYFDDSGCKVVTLVRKRKSKTISETIKSLEGSIGFCELCWRQTEYSAQKFRRYLRKKKDAVEEIQEFFPDENTADIAVEILNIFKLALSEKYGPHNFTFETISENFDINEFTASRVIMLIGIGQFTQLRKKYWDECELPCGQIYAIDIEKNDSLRIELLALIEDAIVALFQKKSNLVGISANKLSNRFCSLHNQYRSEEAKRYYKRDHSKLPQFEQKIEELRSHYLREKLTVFRNNDTDGIMKLRKEAYETLHTEPLKPRNSRKPTKNNQTIEKIDSLLASGITNLSEIAQLIGITRAAVSIAIKRKSASALKSHK